MKYTKEILQVAVDNCSTFQEVVRYFKLKPHGGSNSYLKKRILSYGIDISHFNTSPWNTGKKSSKRKSPEERLVFDINLNYKIVSGKILKSLMEIGREYKCEFCGVETEWRGKKLTLEIDHIDGDFRNNTPSNLRLLCPNCHSQTDNYRSGGRKTKDRKFCKCGKKLGLKNKTGMCITCFNATRKRFV